jgi:hypothetical protein
LDELEQTGATIAKATSLCMSTRLKISFAAACHAVESPPGRVAAFLLLQGKADAKKAKIYGRIGKKIIQL